MQESIIRLRKSQTFTFYMGLFALTGCSLMFFAGHHQFAFVGCLLVSLMTIYYDYERGLREARHFETDKEMLDCLTDIHKALNVLDAEARKQVDKEYYRLCLKRIDSEGA